MTTKPTEDDLHAAFARADLGGDDKLDLMEFTLVLEHLGLAWTRAETQHRFEQADTNFDGFISYSELRAVLESEGWAGGLAPGARA
ncbi:EF-hand domain-containing protein [Actinomadura algeriensis]|uniref:Ca2+-binding EF-hand superfamily protein n=1 Tax=Actinomadura algeriensis TaxID=1679523 RepID=A0ABR9JZQ5_9ACTN|nr:EF-hand domain-containing protein [Actinomadura algeriensis]MBE1536050.1 Ca2+-binding EF-hand superfamily protein [Actinomadura algeriensis]